MTLSNLLARLRRSEAGVAMVELAYSLPIVVPLFVAGAELTNYAITRMRISQIALHVADNASRIGTESLLAAPRIDEGQINDLFTGANLQAGSLDLAGKARVILSSVEPDDDEDTDDTFIIHWQRCFGDLDRETEYPTDEEYIGGVGPAGKRATAPENGGTMFVEVIYDYEPLILSPFAVTAEIKETAAMTVRDHRDYVGPDPDNDGEGPGIWPVAGVTASTCST